MGFFGDTHVTQAGLQGSAGPEVGLWDMIQQGYSQQYRVDSSLALDQELASRWSDSLAALRAAGQNFSSPVNDNMYRRYADFIRNGVPVTDDYTNPLYSRGGLAPPSADFQEMQRADEAIRQLNNPNVKTFEQILDDVSAMQQHVEQQTNSMSQRTGTLGTVGEMIGSMAGSFTLRDPVNIATAPIGFGRTIATRVATDIALNAGITAFTDVANVNPNRELVGLPDHNPVYDTIAAGLGAGLFRLGLIEPFGHLLDHVRGVGDAFDFNVHDQQLQQMFHVHEELPQARAASSILSDTINFEHANPYGEGHIAGYRWEMELENTARALNGEEPAQVEMPPVPHEYVEQALNFQSVKETAPELWQGLEDARAKVAALDQNIAQVASRQLTIPDAVRLVDEEAAAKLDRLSEIVNDEAQPEPVRAAADMEARAVVNRVGQEKIMKAVDIADTEARHQVSNLRASRRAANKQYMTAYRAVEREADRLEQAAVAKRSIAQAQSIDELAPGIVSEPMTGPLTRRDFVETHVTRVEEADKAIPKQAEAVNELKIDPETGAVDIGLKEPIPADFKVPFEEGEMSVKEVLDDLHEDHQLEEAVRKCSI